MSVNHNMGADQTTAEAIAAAAIAAAMPPLPVPTGATTTKRKASNKENSSEKKPRGGKKKGTDPVLGPPTAPVFVAQANFDADSSLTNQNKKDGIPPWRKVQELLLTEESVTMALLQKGILTVPTVCPKCHQSLRFPKKGTVLRCSKCYSRNGGEWSQSLYKGTFFEFGRMKRQDMLMFLYHWLCGAKHKQLCLIMGWSNSTMFRWTQYVIELVATVTFYKYPYEKKHDDEADPTMDSLTNNNDPPPKIGGQDVIVQIDDCNFDKRSCHHPHYVKDGWIFCGVEVTPKRRYFSIVVPDRTVETFMTLVRKHIAMASIIRSSRWTSNDIFDIQSNSQYRLDKQGPPATLNLGGAGTGAGLSNNHNPSAATMLNFATAADHHLNNPFLTHFQQLQQQQQQLQQQQQQLQQQQQQQQLARHNANRINYPADYHNDATWILEEAPPPPPDNGQAGAAPAPPARKHNNVKELPGSLFEFIWRKKHDTNLWNGILWTLSQVKYTE